MSSHKLTKIADSIPFPFDMGNESLIYPIKKLNLKKKRNILENFMLKIFVNGIDESEPS